MCLISGKIKFCTCKATSAEKLQNYWVLHRRNKNKNEIIVGEVVLPYDLIDLNYETNQTILEKRVNEPTAFDVPLVFKNNDVLEIVFNNNEFYKRTVYGFKYHKSQWKIHEIDTFHLIGHFDKISFGKIK